MFLLYKTPLKVKYCAKVQIYFHKTAANSKKMSIFAAEIRYGILGLTGFDSRMRWYVSMRSDGCILHNPFGRTINWRNKVRSRCLIEVQ